jgi:serine/threonine protein kinase
MLCPTCGFNNPNNATLCGSCGAPQAGAAAPPNALAVGTGLRNGAYTVGNVLGRGGFGITYLGSDVNLRRPIATKEFFPRDCARQGNNAVVPDGRWTAETFARFRERFLQEGQTLARFDHPGIVRVHAAFEENDTAYIVMEYLRGKSLLAVLRERGRRMGETEAVGYVEKIGAALEVVHQAGHLHRDVKPENVMVSADGRVVLIDFGAAREFAPHETTTQTTIRTPGYAPPEQYVERARRGAFTDVYALAATLYHLLTGRVPEAAPSRNLGAELADVRQLNPQVSASVAEAVMRGLTMEATQRPQSVSDFLDLLTPRVSPPQSVVAPLNIPSETTTATPPVQPPIPRERVNANNCRAALRSDYAPAVGNYVVGFRCVQSR